jgi:hypothetical protein
MEGEPLIPSFLSAVVSKKNRTLLNITGQFIEFERTELLTVFGGHVGHGGMDISGSIGQEVRLRFKPRW